MAQERFLHVHSKGSTWQYVMADRRQPCYGCTHWTTPHRATGLRQVDYNTGTQTGPTPQWVRISLSALVRKIPQRGIHRRLYHTLGTHTHTLTKHRHTHTLTKHTHTHTPNAHTHSHTHQTRTRTHTKHTHTHTHTPNTHVRQVMVASANRQQAVRESYHSAWWGRAIMWNTSDIILKGCENWVTSNCTHHKTHMLDK